MEKIKKYFKRSTDNNNYIGWLCTYTPEELILSAGFTPFRIYGSKDYNRAEGFFPINFCPYLKSSWESILNNDTHLKSIIFTNSCDGMRRLYDTCKKYSSIPVFMLDVPKNQNISSVNYFEFNLNNLIDFLNSLGNKKITNERIKNSIEIINKKREGLIKLNNMYRNSIIDIDTYNSIIKISTLSDPYLFVEELSNYIDSIKNVAKPKKPNILLIGNFINEDRLWKLFSELDLTLSYQDTCSANRYFEGLVENGNKPLGSIAKRYLYKSACMRIANLGNKITEIKENIKKYKIDGIIYISLKFCDNTLYFYPLLKEELKDIGKPSLYLEIEYNNFSEGQVKTRIQAFLEMIYT